MATVTFAFGAQSKSYTRSAQSLTRLQAYVNATYPTIVNAQGQTVPNPDPLQSFTDALLLGIGNNVKRYEEILARAAIQPPSDLT